MESTGSNSESAPVTDSAGNDPRERLGQLIDPHAPFIPAWIALAVMVVWIAHNGGYDQDTWYWGALVMLSVLVVVLAIRGAWSGVSSPVKVALAAFALYAAFSYLSIAWAGYQGDALTGSNRTLLYLLVFAVFALTPWTGPRGLVTLVAYAVAVGAVGALLLIEMARGHSHIASMFAEGRLVSPTGYFNSTAALFTSAALVSVALAVRRELPVLLRGVLIAVACGGIQIALLGESRGWLFTLPLVLLGGVLVVHDRIRVAIATVVPAVGTLIALHPLLDVYSATSGRSFLTAAQHAGKTSLLVCACSLVVGTLLAAVDGRARVRPPSRRVVRRIGTVVALVALGAGAAGGLAATHGHPLPFVKRQWNGFTHPETGGTSSHFGAVGSGRYDIWRVSLDGFLAHPIGGLGQDNFADYYVLHRHTGEEPKWTHSFELRLLAHTGIVGTIVFAVFLIAAFLAALRGRRRHELAGAVAGAALLPLIVWLIHGSVDWFWEVPALSGPALGLLGMAGRLGTIAPDASVQQPPAVDEQPPNASAPAAEPARQPAVPARPPVRNTRRAIVSVAGLLALVAAVAVLGFPYLSVREVSLASDIRVRNPKVALRDLNTAAKLNPLSSDPTRLAGVIALQNGSFLVAEQRFRQTISRELGGWFGWFGDGLAASALGDTARANRDFAIAYSINTRQPAVSRALRYVDSTHPLTTPEALRLLVLAH
jgi:O-antigen ligase